MGDISCRVKNVCVRFRPYGSNLLMRAAQADEVWSSNNSAMSRDWPQRLQNPGLSGWPRPAPVEVVAAARVGLSVLPKPGGSG
jgi:hypothetical protein